MTIQTVAAAFNGAEYPFEPSKEMQVACKQNNIVIIFGASDDLVELRGAIYDELGDDDFYISREGKLFPAVDDDDNEVLEKYALLDVVLQRQTAAIKVTPKRCAPGLGSWSYETAEPHATFDIMEEGELYCRGMVIQL